MPSDCVANYASTASDNYAQDNSGVSVSAWLDLSLVLLSHLGSLTISDTVAHLSPVLLSHVWFRASGLELGVREGFNY